MIAKLMAESRLRRWRFGRSGERMDAALVQLQLLLDDLQARSERTLHAGNSADQESTQSLSQPRVPRLRRAYRAPCRRTCRAKRSCTLRRVQLSGLRRGVRKLGEASPRCSISCRAISGAAACTAEVLLRSLCTGHPTASAVTTIDHVACAPGLLAQVIVAKWRSLSAVSATIDLPALRRRSRSRDARGVGRWCVAVARTVGCIARPLCARGREAARR
jgi:hypothetical protein